MDKLLKVKFTDSKGIKRIVTMRESVLMHRYIIPKDLEIIEEIEE